MEKQVPFAFYPSILVAMVLFSLTFIWFKFANVSYGPLTIVLFRLTLASVILLLYTKISRKFIMPDRKDFFHLLLLAFFEPFLYFMGESYGLQHISSTVAAVIISTIPLVAPFAGYLFFREKITYRNITGILLSFAGVILVIYEFGIGITASPKGVILQFVAVFSAVGYTVILHKMSRRMNNLSIILFQNILGAIYFLPFWTVFEMDKFMNTPPDVKGLIAIAQLGFFASTIAFILFTNSIRMAGITKSNMYANSIPVFTAILAWIMLGDRLNVQKTIGIMIVIAGLFLAQINWKKRYDGPDPIPFD